jgi:hypothetical protein
MAITQGYRGSVNLGAAPLRMPALPGSRISMPKNYQIPPVAHNMAFQYLYAEGLQVPSVDLDTVVTGDWFTAANLNAWFMTRTSDDLAAIAGPDASTYGMELFDGATGSQMRYPKGNSLILGSSPGSLLQCRMNFMGTDILALTAPTYLVTTAAPLMYNHVSFDFSDSQTGNDVAGWQFMLTNNCMPHPGHPGDVHPSEINASQFIATLRLTLHAQTEIPTDGLPIAFTITPPTASAVTFTCGNPLVMAPNERSLQRSPAYRQYEITLLGDQDAGVEASPVTIA